MIVVVPTLIKQQVLKVGEGRRPGPARRRGWRAQGAEERAQLQGRRARARIGALGQGPGAAGARSASRGAAGCPRSTLPDPGRGWGAQGHLGALLEAQVQGWGGLNERPHPKQSAAQARLECEPIMVLLSRLLTSAA